MSLYTFVMNFKGGTYVSQVNSSSLRKAKLKWAKELEITDIKYFGERIRQELLKELPEEDGALLRGVKNVWFNCYKVRMGFIHVNIIKTEK